MAQAEVIKEFLVSLGFKTDERSLKRFTEGVEKATASVTKMVSAIGSSALVIGAGVSAFASSLEALYFASQKTGASAGGLKAYQKAMQSFGVSANESLQSVKSLASWMRNNPGAESFLNSIGVSTRDKNNNPLSKEKVLSNFGAAMRGKDFWLAKQYADMIGISEDALLAMHNGEFEKELAKQQGLLKNSGFDKAAKDAHEFMENLRELATYMEAFGLKVQNELMKKLGGSMESFSAWFRENEPMIAERTAEVVRMMIRLAEIAGPAIGWIAEKFIELDGATDGWSTKLLAMLAIFKMIGGAAVISGLMALSRALFAVGSATTAAASGGLLSKLLPFVSRMAGAAGLMFYSGGLNEGEDAWAEEQRKKRQQMGDGQSGAKDRLAQLEKKYGLPAGLLDSVWNAESGRGKNMRSTAGAEGHFQFMPGTAKQYGLKNPYDFDQSSEAAAQYYRDLFKKYGNNLEKAVAAYNWGPGNVDRNGLGALPAETRNYLDKVKRGMGESAVQISQNTTINVTGGDAAATGRAVASEQSRVAQQTARTMQLALN